MVQVLTRTPRPEKPSFLQSVLGGIGQGVMQGAESQRELEKLSHQSNLRQKEMGEKLQGDTQIENRDYDAVKNKYGAGFADVWRASDAGAKTQLMGLATEFDTRGMDIRDIFGDEIQGEMPRESSKENQRLELDTSDFISKDYDKGLTPAERTKRENDRYAKNLPILEESDTKRRAYEAEEYHLDILEDLSPQIDARDKFLTNPLTGQLMISGVASPAAQQFEKTINDFTVNAKDSYGSRVTNFDLQQFMKRLPTLGNSEEARRRILQQMKIINKMNNLYESSFQDMVEKSGGSRKIDIDEARRITDKKLKKPLADLRSEFSKIDKEVSKMYYDKVSDYKKKTPKGSVAIRTNEGKLGYIPTDQLKEFLKDKAGEAL